MWLVYWLFLLNFCEGNPAAVAMNDWLNELLENINQYTQPYQVTIFINNTTTTPEYRTVFQKFIKKIPSATIDVSEMASAKKLRLMAQPVFENPRHVTLYVVLDSTSKDNDTSLSVYLKNITNFFVQVSPKSVRPKCLVITIKKDCYEDNYRTLFEYTWTKKFIDFTIVEIKAKAKPVIHNYNPFTQKIKTEYFYRHINMFPDKVLNVNGYPLKVPVFMNPPHMNITRDEQGRVADIDGFYYQITKIASKAANFTIEYALDLNNISSLLVVNKTIDAMVREEVNMLPVPFPSIEENSTYADLVIELDVGYIYVDTIVVVPVTYFIELLKTLEVLFMILVIPFVIAAFSRILQVIRINYVYVRLSDLFRVLLGTSAVVKPTKLMDRMVFISIIGVSVTYSFTFYTRLINVNVIQSEVTYDTFQAISESPLNININKIMFNRTFNLDNPYVQRIKRKTVAVLFTSLCDVTMVNNKTSMCLMSSVRATMLTGRYRNFDGSEITKIAKPVFASERWTYIFERGSPYIERFHQLMQRIHESGIWRVIKYRVKYVEKLKFKKEKSSAKTVFLTQIVSILVVGYALSILIFAIEYILYQTGLHKCFNRTRINDF